MQKQIESYIEFIKENYKNWQPCNEIRLKMVEEFNGKIHAEYGKKYVKIIGGNGGVHSFVVIESDDKFKAGDILKAASWKTPAKNFSRGSVFESHYTNITWTGAH